MLALNLEAWTAGGEGAWNGERGGEEGEGRGLGLGLGRGLGKFWILELSRSMD